MKTVVVRLEDEVFERVKKAEGAAKLSGDDIIEVVYQVKNGKEFRGQPDLIDRRDAINIITFGKNDKAIFGDSDTDQKVIDFLNTLQ